MFYPCTFCLFIQAYRKREREKRERGREGESNSASVIYIAHRRLLWADECLDVKENVGKGTLIAGMKLLYGFTYIRYYSL